MSTLLTLVSERSVKIQDEVGLDALLKKPETQVSAEPPLPAERGPPFNANCCFRRNLYCYLGTYLPLGASEGKLIRWFAQLASDLVS